MPPKNILYKSISAKAEEHAILASENRKDIIFSNVYHVIVASTGCLAFLSPFAIAGFYAWHGESFWENLEAPARATYVIDKKSVLGYSIICLWNVIFIYSLLYGSVSIDTLFSWLMCNIVAHFRILKYRLRQAGRECNGNRSEKSIYDCIAYHYRTLELAKNFNDAFRAIVFIKFAISCIQICCLAFQLRRGGELFFQVYQGAFLLSVTLQLTLYCYGGQRIENESDSIANIIYDSFHWEALTVSNKKLLIFAMKRSQESCKVSGIFFTANLRLLLWVYRTAASFITLLWTMDEKGNAMQ